MRKTPPTGLMDIIVLSLWYLTWALLLTRVFWFVATGQRLW